MGNFKLEMVGNTHVPLGLAWVGLSNSPDEGEEFLPDFSELETPNLKSHQVSSNLRPKNNSSKLPPKKNKPL